MDKIDLATALWETLGNMERDKSVSIDACYSVSEEDLHKAVKIVLEKMAEAPK